MNNRKRISISPAGAEYLARLHATDGAFAQLLRRDSGISIEGNSVLLSRGSAETLRAFFTEKLAKVGFDERYAANPEGSILEELIDRFFMPTEE